MKRFIIVIEVDPPSHSVDSVPPLRSVTHHYRSALGIVFVDAHGKNVRFALDTKFFVYFMFYWQPMSVPSEPPLHVKAASTGMSSYYILRILRLYSIIDVRRRI